MSSKKVLSCLLVLCLIFSVLTPAAGAVGLKGGLVQAVTNNKVNAVKPGASSALGNGILASGNAASSLHTLRDHPLKEQNPIGSWTIEQMDKNLSASIKDNQLPTYAQELKDAAKDYDPNEIVSAFIWMERAPLVDSFDSILDVEAADEKPLLDEQQAVIETIEKHVLGGGELTVESQITYLANGIAIRTAFANLEKMVGISGVKSVFLMPVYEPCEVEDSNLPYTIPSGSMSGVSNVWSEELGFTGSGMTIAILDTGLDLDHPSFAAAPALGEGSWDKEYLASMLDKLYASYLLPGLSVDDLYYNEKIPFAFNYGSDNLDVSHKSDGNDHGTHVAGIAAANPVEGSGVVGMAPDAQIIAMKVFQPGGGAATIDILEALQDAMILGCDVVNMSLGSSAGFSSSGNELIDSVYAALANCDMIVNISAGNDAHSGYGNMYYSMLGINANPTFAPDNSLVSSPSTYANVSSIASADNIVTVANAIILNGAGYMYNDAQGLEPLSSLAGQKLEYVMIGGYGEPADFEGKDVSGKIAVIARGVTNFSSKLANAEAAGAIGVIITNNAPGSIANLGMSMTDANGNLADGVSGAVPCVLVSMATGEALQAALASEYTLSVSAAPTQVVDEAGGQMSSFSAWGVAPDLRLLPDITGVGGNIYSCYDNGKYGYMSGTSMSAPQVSGITALVLQYLRTQMEDGKVSRELLDQVLMSTAVPIISTDTGLEASPRQQGTGLVNAYNAVTSGAYLSVNGGAPKAELFDDPDKTGSYSFTFSVHNFSDAEKSYKLDASLLTEAVDPDYAGAGLFMMAGYETALEGKVSFSQDTVTVAAGAEVEITVSIELSDYDKAWLDYFYPNGGYVEGYVYLENADENGVDLSLPYMGFYGDWTALDAFDYGYWYDNSFFGAQPVDDYVDAVQYFNVMWTSLGMSDWVLGLNPYTGPMMGEDGKIIYDPANNVVSPNGDGYIDNISEMYISMLRNAKALVFTYSDAETGEIYDVRGSLGVYKTFYRSSLGQVYPYIHSDWYGSEIYNFTDEAGNPLPDGTKLTLTIEAFMEYGDDGNYDVGLGDQYIEIPVTVDISAPQLVGANSVTINDRNYLVLTVDENVNLAYAAVMNPTGTQILDEAAEFTEEYGCYTVVLDITGYGTELMVVLGDYGANESYYGVAFSGNDNLPYMDEHGLYAYRQYDASNTVDESFYGWVSIDKATGDVTQITNDELEYAAINAAEYVDGNIFAVDAVGNFLLLQPGTFFRTTICNIGFNAWDMTWDESSNTMYISGSMPSPDGYGDIYYLCTIDLLTGVLTPIIEGYGSYQVPLAMAATPDGVIYAVTQNYSDLYTVDVEAGELVPVLDAEGNAVELKLENGKAASPYYIQSMSYSAADDCIYYAFCSSRRSSELMKIVPNEDGTVSLSSKKMPIDTELVGMFVLDEDEDYSLPQPDALEIIRISAESLSLMAGEMAQLEIACLPWNYALTEPVVWSSSDPSVAYVVDGIILGLSEGQAVITAQCEGVSAQCLVSVMEAYGEIYGYAYYSGVPQAQGHFVMAELSTMGLYDIGASAADFISGSYNVHDGCFYGYTEDKQLHRMDFATGETVTVGSGDNLIWDMAYDMYTGAMYGVDPQNYMLYYIDMNTGAQMPIGQCMMPYIAITCGVDGVLYGMGMDGVLYELIPYPDYGYVDAMPLVEGLPMGSYLQSMTYDFNTDKIIWACPDMVSYYMIDPAMGAYVDLGNPFLGQQFQVTGMFALPSGDLIPELPYVPVSDVQVEDMLVFVGSAAAPNYSVYPFNATNKTVVWTSEDPSIATVNPDGSITGISEGVVTIKGTIQDGEDVLEISYNAYVKVPADNLTGYVIAELATGGGWAWSHIDVADPKTAMPDIPNPYTMYSAQYVEADGLVYGYGYDDEDWSSNFQFFVFDPSNNYEIISMIDMGEGFPFVYELTYDYTTGTMYALAGYGEAMNNIYAVDLKTGTLIPVMDLEILGQSMVAGPDGKLYFIADSTMEIDWMTWEYILGNAVLYEIDPAAGTCEYLFDLGVQSNMIGSAAYDFDTDAIYWTRFATTDPMSGMYDTSLTYINVEEQICFDIDTVCPMGAQVSALHFVCDSYPKAPAGLHNIIMTSNSESMKAGDSVELGILVQPSSFSGVISWSSSDSSVATVDSNGVVTAVGSGVATITATARDSFKTCSASCKIVVFGENDYLISWNSTDGVFTGIDRLDPSKTFALSEPGDFADVRTMALVGEIIYGYDVDGNFFSTSAYADFQRTALGSHGVEPLEVEDYYQSYFEVRDMAWDPVGQRMLVLGCHKMFFTDEYDEVYDLEILGGNRIYEADLATGKLTELVTLNSEGDYYSHGKAITVDADGVVYVYSTYMDYIATVDMESGELNFRATLQSMSLYGTSENQALAMAYDELTDSIYLLFTSNGNFYRMIHFNPNTSELTLLGYVDEYANYMGDAHAGLLINPKHEHIYGDWKILVAPSCDGDGMKANYCALCGDLIETAKISALGHTVVDSDAKDPDCTHAGYTAGKQCSSCGEIIEGHKEIPALGHSYESVVTPPTTTEQGYTTHTCSRCGDSYKDSFVDPIPEVIRTFGTVTASALTIRKGPGTSNAAVGYLYKGEKVEILEQTEVNGKVWGRIDRGWICLTNYVKLETVTVDPNAPAKEIKTVTASVLNIRKGPGTTYAIVGSYKKGDEVEVLATQDVNGTIWVQTDKGWISSKYLK